MKAIGVFDSGMGGLTVWRELRRLMPEESLLYYADGAHCPFGNKPPEEVRGYVVAGVEALMEQGVKMVVLACNAATATAVDYLRATYDIPFVGMEPAVKPAAQRTQSGVIGILATKATLESDIFHRTVQKYASGIRTVASVGEGFVELVESGRIHGPEAHQAVSKALTPLLEAGADQIVLGCTHYPFLIDVIREVIGPRDVQVIDPSPAVAKRTLQVLTEKGLAADKGSVPVYEFLTAADGAYLSRIRQKAAEIASGL